MADIGTLEATLGIRTAPLDKARDAMGRFVRDADKQMGQVEGSTKRVDTATGNLSGTFMKLGATMAAALSVRQVTRFAQAAVAEFGKVQDSIAAAATLFGGMDVDVGALQSRMYELSSATGLAADEIGTSLYQALSAGIPVTEDMGAAMGFVGSAAKIAKAGFTDMSTAVEATAKTLNAYRMNVSEAEKVHRILLTTQNRGITTVDDLGRNLAKVTPTAAAFGVAFEEVGAAISVMTAQGIRTEMSTTYLSQVISELGKQGTVAAKALGEAATAAGMADTTMKDMIDSGMSLGEILNVMATYAKNSGQSVMDMFGSIEAGKAVLALTGQNASKFAEILEEMYLESNLVDESYGTLMATLNTQNAVARNNFKLLQGTIGEMLAPALIDITGRMNDWLISTRDLLAENLDEYADNIAKAVKFAADNLDKVAFLVKGIVAMKLYTWLITATTGTYGFATALGVAATAAKTLGRALLFGFIVEGITLVLEGIGKINEMVNNTPLTWGAAARVAGDAFVNGLINSIRALVLILPKLINDIIVRPIAESLSSLFSAKTITSIIQGKPLDVLYDMAEAHANEVTRVLNEAGVKYQEIANERLLPLASPEDMAAWNLAITWTPEVWTPPVPEDVETTGGGTGEGEAEAEAARKAAIAAQESYLNTLKNDYQRYQDELTLMDYEGYEARRKAIDLWAESLEAEIRDAGAWSSEIESMIGNVVNARKELIDMEHSKGATTAANDAKAALALLQMETQIMENGPEYWKRYQEQNQGNEALEEWIALLHEAEVSQAFIDEFTNKFGIWTERNKEAQTELEKWTELSQNISDAIGGVFEQMSDHIVSNLMQGKAAFEDFGDFAMMILEQVLKQMITIAIINPLASGVDKLMLKLFPSEHGNVFGAQRNLIPFATGGVVTRPTIFPFASGTGLMGEAGPEAILP
ncbi:MAG: phage tail tape measure protein, partial [Acholeplasmataceae bacterium]